MNSTAQFEEDTFEQRLDWRVWRRIFAYALRYPLRVGVLAFNAFVVAGIDASFALVTRAAIDAFTLVEAGRTGVPSLLPYAGTYFALCLTLAMGIWIFINMAGSLANHIAHDMRADGFQRLQELELAYYDKRPVGWLISRLTSDCDKLSRIIAWGFLDILWASSMVSFIAIILLIMDLKLGTIILATVPPLVILSLCFQKRLLLSARETRRFNSILTATINENLQGMSTSRSLVREAANQKEFEANSQGMYAASVRHALQSALYLPLVLTLGSIAGGLILWSGGAEVIAGNLSLGTLVAFLFYSARFFDPINEMAETLVQMQGAQAAGERVTTLIETQPQIRDSAEVTIRLQRFASHTPPGLAPDGHPAIIRNITFHNVDFHYENGEPVLRAFNLEVKAGETIALVGASGGGKSTIVSLLSRFYEPTSGELLVNGIDYRRRSLYWWQSQQGIVLQTPHLFNGTVRDNIRYGRLEASDAEIEEAARQVQAHDFIIAMEEGYDTALGEGGNRLSTGQKQLISFARAVLARPQIFIMDEATSSIDAETEQRIQAGLRTILSGRISFVIAHRLSTIRSADRILYIEGGRILEEGNHRSLLAQRGSYFKLYASLLRETSSEPVR